MSASLEKEAVGAWAHEGLVKSWGALLDFYTALALKKRTWRISKKLLHAERFIAPHCLSLSFTHQSNSTDSWSSAQAAAEAAAATAGNEMDCESDGAEARVALPHREEGAVGRIGGFVRGGDQGQLNFFSFVHIWPPEHNARRHRDLARGFACNAAKCNANAC